MRDLIEFTKITFFFKQWGGFRAKSGGRELDEREWNEMPDDVGQVERPLIGANNVHEATAGRT